MSGLRGSRGGRWRRWCDVRLLSSASIPNSGFALFLHQRPPTRRDVSILGSDSSAGRCRNDTDPARRQIRPLKRLAYLNPPNHLSVNSLQPAASIRQLWEMLASWKLITQPAMLMSVPPRAVIAFFLNNDTLIWCVDPQTSHFCRTNPSSLPAPNRMSQSHRRHKERPRGTYREWFAPVCGPP